MLLGDLRESIESGKTAKLFVPKTHEFGVNLTIRVAKIEKGYIWQRGRIEEPTLGIKLPAKSQKYEAWEKLMLDLKNSMQLRDTTWEESNEPIEIEKTIEKGEPQLNLIEK